MKEKIFKKGITRRLLSVVLTLAMVLSLLPLNATLVYAAEPHEHDDIIFTQWSSDSSLPSSGNYYLTKDVTLPENTDWQPTGNVTFCLNGHNIKLNSNCIRVNSGVELNLYDCNDTNSAGGHITEGEDESIFSAIIVYGSFNMYGGDIADNNKGGVAVEAKGQFNLYDGNITGNNGIGVSVNGSAANSYGKFKMIGGSITNNSTSDKGGGVYVNTHAKFIMIGGEISGNTAKIGAGVYVNGEDSSGNKGNATLLGGIISNNTASENGGGVFLDEKKEGGCIAEGTMITMADGSCVAVENLQVGDVLRVFDHETGTYTSAPLAVNYIHEQAMRGAYTLHFSGDVNVKILDEHAFFEKETNNYVVLNESNVEDYIGHSFYDLDNDCWRILDSVTKHDEPAKAYALYTTKYLNHVTEGMLSCEGICTAAVCNPFELDENMKIIPEKKEADIAKWGLFTYEDQNILIEEAFDVFPLQNLYVAIGKGLATMGKFEWQMLTFGSVAGICQPGIGSSFSNVGISLLSLDPEPSFDSCNGLVLGGTIQITSNKKTDSTDNDLYVNNNKCKLSAEFAPESTMRVGLANVADTQITDEASLSDDAVVDCFYVNSAMNPVEKVVRHNGDIWVVKQHNITNNAAEANKETNSGYVTVNGTAYSFETVTVNVTANKGYHLDKLQYTDSGNKTINKENDIYSFVMPKADTTVTATFTHTHGAWSYEATNNTITANCNLDECDSSFTLTLTASDANYSDSAVTKTDLFSSTMDTNITSFNTLTNLDLSVNNIKIYAKSDTGKTNELDVITANGWYVAELTVDTNKTARLEFPVGNTFTVTFDANGHGTAPAEIKVLKDQTFTAPTAPTASGYTFGGWYKEKECTTAWNFATDEVTQNTTLYAKWTQNNNGGYRPSSGGSYTPPATSNATISGDTGNTSNISVNTNNGNAVISNISSTTIESIANSTTNGNDIVIDVSAGNSSKEVNSVTITKTTAENISKALDSSDNNKENLIIKIQTATVSIDATALSAIAEQAKGDDIRLVVENTKETTLNESQKAQVESLSKSESKEVVQSFEAYFVSGGSRISNFNGGMITVGKIDFRIPAGKNAKNYHIYYIPESGAAERYETWAEGGSLYFRTTHFSDYAIVYDEELENDSFVTVYRLFNIVNGKHLLTADRNEAEYLVGTGKWSRDNDMGKAGREGTAVYRLFNVVTGEHLYTSDVNEIKIQVAKKTWVYDNDGKPIFYGLPSGTAVYRLHNIKKSAISAHLNTSDVNEIERLLNEGYVLENSSKPMFYLQ